MMLPQQKIKEKWKTSAFFLERTDIGRGAQYVCNSLLKPGTLRRTDLLGRGTLGADELLFGHFKRFSVIKFYKMHDVCILLCIEVDVGNGPESFA